MQIKPSCSVIADGTVSESGRVVRWRAVTAGGFALVELLAVMAIIALLMAASSALFRATGSRAGEPAARLARCIELARAQAVANNQRVAIRFVRNDSGELVMRFLRSRVGQAAAQLKDFRRPERFADVVIAPGLACPRQASDAPESHALASEESLVITADGQVLLGSGTNGFPAAAAQMVPAIHLGVQPTRRGQVAAADRRDVAIVQIQCATGTARVLLP